MKLTAILLMLFATIFLGCGSDDSTKETQNSSTSPQPDVKDETIQPPKPPTI